MVNDKKDKMEENNSLQVEATMLANSCTSCDFNPLALGDKDHRYVVIDLILVINGSLKLLKATQMSISSQPVRE